MRRLLVTGACVALASACASPDKGFGKSSEVHRSDLGGAWPLTVDSALLTCNHGAVAVTVDGRTHLIDRTTRPRDASRKLSGVWSRHPSGPVGRTDLEPLVEHGESLCN